MNIFKFFMILITIPFCITNCQSFNDPSEVKQEILHYEETAVVNELSLNYEESIPIEIYNEKEIPHPTVNGDLVEVLRMKINNELTDLEYETVKTELLRRMLENKKVEQMNLYMKKLGE